MSKSRALKNRESKQKANEEKVYTYGRGARKTTDYGEYSLATGRVTRLPSGQSGSLKVQSMQKKKEKEQQAYEKAFNRKLNRVR
jgi:hypothetical protein